MVAPATLRRKLQKKKKHKPYRKCPDCGRRCELVLRDDRCHSFCKPRLFVLCGQRYRGGVDCNDMGNVVLTDVRGEMTGCGFARELFWSGGGTGRHIPH